MFQFFSESFLVVGLAFAVALLVVTTSLNWFNELAGKQMEMPWTNTYFWLSSFAFILFTGLLAGSYRALLILVQCSQSAKGDLLRAGRLAHLPRKVLVVTSLQYPSR